jgi:hypothetical protein
MDCSSRFFSVVFPCCTPFPPENHIAEKKADFQKITLDGLGSHCYHIIRFAQKAQAIQTPIQSGGFWTSPIGG